MKLQGKQELITAVSNMNIKVIRQLIAEQPKKERTNTPSAGIKVQFIKLIKEHASNPQAVFKIGKDLYETSSDTELEIGIILLADSYEVKKDYIQKALYAGAISEHWEVREWAAEAIAIVLIKDYKGFICVLKEWITEDYGFLRRAVAVGVRYASKTIDPQYAEEILDLTEPLLADKDEYVRKNLGAYTIGDGLLKHYPTNVLKRLNHWSKELDEQVRWNVAMTFTSAVSTKYAAEGLEILKGMEDDERPYVKRAVQKAKRNLKASF